MSDSPKEILRYSLDLSEVESGAARLQQLIGEIGRRKAAGQETLGLEEQLQREVAALGRLAPQTKQAASATDELLKNKERLASVVGLLGGQFGGLVSQLSNVIALAGTGGKLLLGFGGALAVVTVGIELYQRFSASIKEAVEQQQKMNAALDEANMSRLPQAESIAAELAKSGAATAENVNAANALDVKLRERFGLPAAVSRNIAAQSVAAGIGDVEQAAQLAVLSMRGAKVDSPDAARRAMEVVQQQGTGADLLAEAQEFSQTPGAIHARALALGEEKMPPRTRAVNDAFDSLKRAGTLPAGVDSAEKLRGLIDEYEKLDAATRDYNPRVVTDPTQYAPALAAMRKRDAFAAKTGVLPAMQFIEQVEELQRGERESTPSPVSPGAPGSERVGQTVTVVNNDNRTIQITGTVYNGGARNPLTYNKPGAATFGGHDRAAPN